MTHDTQSERMATRARTVLDPTIERRLLAEGAGIVRRLHRDAVNPDVLAHLRGGGAGGGVAFLERVRDRAD
jgi:hypothetical protein